MQIEDREPVAPLEALDAPDPVLAQHEHPQVDEGVDVGDEVEAVVVEVEEDEAVRRVEVLHALDEVVLEAQQPQARLGLENGDSWKRKRAERVTGGLRVRNGLPYRAASTFIFIQLG